MPETANHQFVYFDKTKLPFKPDFRQIIYFNVSSYSRKMDYFLTEYIYNSYNEIRIKFATLGFDFIFLPRISRLFDSEELYRYFKPDATDDDLRKFQHSIRYSHDSKELVEYLLDMDPMKIKHFPTGLICYAGPQYDTPTGYAFFYMPFPKGERCEERFVDIHSLEEFFRKYVHEFSNVFFKSTFLKEEREKCVRSQPSICYDLDDWGDDTCRESVALKETWADQNFSTDVTGMLSDVQALILQLRQRGVSQWILEDIIKSPRTLSRLHIKGTRIFLTDYNNMEITMGPLPKAVFILFLRHPEGIRFACLPDYREELYEIYSMLTSEEDDAKIRQSVADVTDPTRNSINENASRIRRAFVDKIDPELAKHYFITGERGEEKKITLSRDLVDWDTFLVSQ